MNKFLLILIISFYLIFPFIFVLAAPFPLVPSECRVGDIAKNCNFCHLLRLTDNVFNFAIYSIAIPLVVIMIIYGGFVIMTAGDSTDKTAQG